jgi:cytochrome c oxidase subunit III
MATTANEPVAIPITSEERDRRPRLADSSGNGGHRNLAPANGKMRGVKDYSPPPASTGIWVVIASIAMTFAAFTSAIIVRQGGATDWHHLTLPRILYLNTLVLFASSFALEKARRQVGAFMVAQKTLGPNTDASKTQTEKPTLWLYISLALGLLFVAGQYVAWLQLRAQGLFLNTNPNSSFFYVLTAIHAIHVLGGLGGLVRVISRLNRSILRKSTLDATAYYWHFMDALWVYLLLLLWMKL